MKLLYRMTVTILALAIYFPATAVAQAYPDKPVRVIVVFPPGGSNDVVARIVFQKMSEIMGQQFVIENRGGAAGTIGSEVVASTAADGYTIMVQSATHVANPHLYKKLPYDALKDFVGVTTLARQVGMLVVHPSLPAKSVKEFIALARTRPGEINYASAGNGSFVHLTVALFASTTVHEEKGEFRKALSLLEEVISLDKRMGNPDLKRDMLTFRRIRRRMSLERDVHVENREREPGG